MGYFSSYTRGSSYFRPTPKKSSTPKFGPTPIGSKYGLGAGYTSTGRRISISSGGGGSSGPSAAQIAERKKDAAAAAKAKTYNLLYDPQKNKYFKKTDIAKIQGVSKIYVPEKKEKVAIKTSRGQIISFSNPYKPGTANYKKTQEFIEANRATTQEIERAVKSGKTSEVQIKETPIFEQQTYYELEPEYGTYLDEAEYLKKRGELIGTVYGDVFEKEQAGITGRFKRYGRGELKRQKWKAALKGPRILQRQKKSPIEIRKEGELRAANIRLERLREALYGEKVPVEQHKKLVEETRKGIEKIKKAATKTGIIGQKTVAKTKPAQIGTRKEYILK